VQSGLIARIVEPRDGLAVAFMQRGLVVARLRPD